MITILGATGNVGKKIAAILVKKGEKVRLISRSQERLRPVVGKLAQAYIGDALDTEFLVQALKGSDAVFSLIPPNAKAENFLAYADRIGESIANAVRLAGVRYVVNLSSVGAELSGGTGPIVGLHNHEERLNRTKGLNVLHLRAGYFMENFRSSIDLIRSRGVNGGTIRGDARIAMVATRDIAAVAAERLIKRDFTGSSVQYLLGPRDLTMIEATREIGMKISKPDLAYVLFPYDEAEKGLIAAGLSPDMSRLYAEMGKAFNEEYIKKVDRTPENTTPTSFEEFCSEVLVPAYKVKQAA